MIDQLARTSAVDLRAATTSDVEAGLADLHVRQARHRRRTQVRAVAAVVLAVGLGWGAGAALTQGDDRGANPVHPTPSRSCPAMLRVACLGDDTYRFALARPVQWHIPSDFGVASGAGVTPVKVESYRDDGMATITVMERAHVLTGNWDRIAVGVADTPRAFMHWIASRPYLSAGPVRTTTLDGHPAWQVQVRLAPGVATTGSIAIIGTTNNTTGIVAHETAEYTALSLPGAGITVVEARIFDPAHERLNTLEQVIHGLSWPTG
jgi:hypothetical protein